MTVYILLNNKEAIITNNSLIIGSSNYNKILLPLCMSLTKQV